MQSPRGLTIQGIKGVLLNMREYTIQVLKTSVNKSLYYIITVVGILQIMCADIAVSEKYWMLTIESAVNCWI